MKVIIPVAGAGTMLRPHTYTQPKALIPVAGKPILGFIIDRLQEQGLNDFIFVVGYLGDKIKSYINDAYPEIKAEFPLQSKRDGLGHAIWTAKSFVGEDEEVLIYLGDTIIEADLQEVVNSKFSTVGLKKVDNPTQFGVAALGDDGFLTSAIEKPRFPKSNKALVGVYKIKESKALFEFLEEQVKKEKRNSGEIQLTDAIMSLIKSGVKIKSFKVNNWYDCGKADVLLETNAILLKKWGGSKDINEHFSNTVIVEPVSIANGVKISNCIIGPNVTIGENADLENAILKNSIIGAFSRLRSIALHDSIIGSDCILGGMSQSLNIGDDTEIDLSGRNKENGQ
ncbi:MAG: sugar phosphate nucleotidyltransferase [Chitinophagales bacterium]